MTLELRSLEDPHRFEDLCTQLVYAEYPKEAQAICGHGGDKGIDVLKGRLAEGATIYQVKYFYDRLKTSRRRQIEDSLKKAAQHKPKQWVLCVAVDLTVGELQWFDNLRSQYPDIELDIWDDSEITHLLIKHDKVRRQFRLGDTSTPETVNIHELYEFALYLWEKEVRTGERFSLRDKGVVHFIIGRSRGCQFRIDNKYAAVSRRHARIQRTGDKVIILDGDGGSTSRHGTFVNGVLVDDKSGIELNPGDKIVLGGFENLEQQFVLEGACLLTFEKENFNGAQVSSQ